MSKVDVMLTGVFLILFGISTTAQEYSITFKVDMRQVANASKVSLHGSVRPLSWDNAYELLDDNSDGIFEAKILFKTSDRNLKFKFSNNGDQELQGSDPRVIWFKEETLIEEYTFNEYRYYSTEQRESLRFNPDQIREDIAVLKRVVQYVHPNVYKYRDSLALQQDFSDLEAEMLSNPTLETAYGAVSKFAANIKCSHTFTNPWNQNINVEMAIFNQPDKVPFTFNRIGKRLFIDKNASENDALVKGREILKINNIPTLEVMTRLAQYVTSDGNNYEKKLERLLVDGAEKYSLFDIFYPIEFGSPKEFELELCDNESKESFTISVKATSKTNRTMVLNQHYNGLETSLEEGWKFELLDATTAHLTIKSFAVQQGEFNWKRFLDEAFDQLKSNGTQNLIIDIRGNEGGQGEVGEYILERLIQSPIEAPKMVSSVRYKTIPQNLKKYINTWDQFPYDFSRKIQSEENGKYLLKDKYSVSTKVYKPKKDGFKGKSYLITDASNSSATHLMAMYAKAIDGITVVGQETGGNQRGTNGSFMFFLRLPNTKVELDIPVIGMQVASSLNEIPDSGVIPDVLVKKSSLDFSQGIDSELKTILELIKNND